MAKFLFVLLGCFLFFEYCAGQEVLGPAGQVGPVGPAGRIDLLGRPPLIDIDILPAAATDSMEIYRPALETKSKSWPGAFPYWPIWYQCKINPFLPKCKCFFRWLYFCYPYWSHPMCQCTRFCPW
ncbi:uncharacterized protein LOC143911696 [Arctopsyche grandis]|uniref:uncharacterized protein LOC143911696 n=1 Tax=Arctopsyche grandis TaxID=121162 RepID=UPI00406D6665